MIGDFLVVFHLVYVAFFFFKQKTAYEMRISDWSSDVCSSDLLEALAHLARDVLREAIYPYPDGEAPYDEDGFVAAIEAEDEATAAAMIRGALAADRKSVV